MGTLPIFAGGSEADGQLRTKWKKETAMMTRMPAGALLAAGLMLGIANQLPTWTAILVIPIFAWELSLALWLIVKGFNSSAIRGAPASESARTETNELLSAA